MNMRRPAQAARSLNVAAGQPAAETPQIDAKASRELLNEIRGALVEARYFGPMITEYGPGYSKLICPQKNDAAHPRTLVVVQADMSLTVRHPHDCACDSIRRPIVVLPGAYAGKDIGAFVISKIEELHRSRPRLNAALDSGPNL